MTSMAFMFSSTCSGREAPVITVETSAFFRHQASASWARVQPRSSAMGFRSRATRRRHSPFSPSRVRCSQVYFSSDSREPSGMPSSYLPVRIPLASGDQVVVPRP